MIADSVGAPDWVRWLSPYTHLARVPYEAPNWPGAAGMLVLAAVLTAGGGFAYQRRDLTG